MIVGANAMGLELARDLIAAEREGQAHRRRRGTLPAASEPAAPRPGPARRRGRCRAARGARAWPRWTASSPSAAEEEVNILSLPARPPSRRAQDRLPGGPRPTTCRCCRAGHRCRDLAAPGDRGLDRALRQARRRGQRRERWASAAPRSCSCAWRPAIRRLGAPLHRLAFPARGRDRRGPQTRPRGDPARRHRPAGGRRGRWSSPCRRRSPRSSSSSRASRKGRAAVNLRAVIRVLGFLLVVAAGCLLLPAAGLGPLPRSAMPGRSWWPPGRAP